MLYTPQHRTTLWILVLTLLVIDVPSSFEMITRAGNPPSTLNNTLQTNSNSYQRQYDNLKSLPVLRAPVSVETPKDIENEKKESLAGISLWVGVKGVLAEPILQKPEDNAMYVSNKPGYITQFRQATQNGVTGLLAHNYLSGKDFYNLDVGKIVSVLYSDERIRTYQVASIHRYQKLIPSRLDSGLLELDSLKDMTSLEVFQRYYQGDHHVVFQTCLEGDGRLDWGLLFVIALPVN